MHIKHFFDPDTFTLTYVVSEGTDAVVIDPVLDYDPVRAVIDTHSAQRVLDYIQAQKLRVSFILETHAHADHVTASHWLSKKIGAQLAIGEGIKTVQATFKRIYALDTLHTDGSQFDRLLADGETLDCGALQIKVMATPGHTPGCVTYLVGDAAFVGDAIFIEDYGCGRCDFPGGDPDLLYTSIHDRLYALAPETRLFPGHDYLPNGRALRTSTTVETSRNENVQIKSSMTRAEFVKFRKERDKTLSTPKLLWPSVQINIDAGRVPGFLRIPVNAL
jgi:glyoxylase-like metal-dependent hydrolase (beta-lactamase superfamily II)